jgi:hypothetical protein
LQGHQMDEWRQARGVEKKFRRFDQSTGVEAA